MSLRVRAAAAAVAGVVLGAVATLSIQSLGAGPGIDALPTVAGPASSAPATYLAWVPRGLPEGFGDVLETIPELGDSTVVAEDIVWLEGSWSAGGERVDDPSPRYAIPLDAAAVDPLDFSAFLPEADQPAIAEIADGQAILSSTGAALRGLGPGAVLEFGDDVRVRVAAVWPDELLGAAEVLVARDVGRRIGIAHERYALVRPTDPAARVEEIKRLLRPELPASLGVNRKIQIRAPGDTPFFRAGDAVLPLAAVKALFGEFAARPRSDHPGLLIVDPKWLHANIEKVRIPAIGLVTCHRAIVPQLRGAMEELVDAGLGSLVESYHGCFVPRYIGSDPANMLSYHSWGIAFDINLVGNYRGEMPEQPEELVEVLERWGFTWGGRWLVPDGSHFEFHRVP